MSHSVPEKNYIPSLDGLRAASIAIVFLAHAGVSNMIPGGFGVTVFFFLSGYLITSLLVAEYDTYRSVSIKAFYLRRVIRLGPPLLITLIFASFLVLIGVAEGDLSPGAVFSQLFFYYNYYSLYVENAGDGVSGLAILWSLAVEEHFYLVFPWIFLLLAAGRIRVRTLSVFLVLVLVWRMVRFYGFGDSEWKIYISTDTRIDSILYGCMLALLVGSKKASDWFPSRFMYPMLAAAFVVLMISFVVRDPAFRSTIRYSLQGLALMPIFYFATSKHELWLFRPLNWKPVRRIGQYSYTIYLVHFVIINAMVFQSVLPDNKLLFTALAAAISIAFAALVFELAEKPLKPLRQRLSGH